ncbi:amino acid ABC transporter substrate-binding protein [Vibrio sp. WJH972]
MKQFFKKIILGLALVAVANITVAAERDVKVGMSGQYFPFTFVKQDELQGFEVDIWNEIGKRNDWNVEFVTANFSGLFGLLETGRIDTISNQITITEARLAKYSFSTPYVIDGVQIVVRKGNDSINGVEDLKGKKVAVNLGSNFEEVLRKHNEDDSINIVTYDTGIERDVALGRADAFVMDKVSSLALIEQSGLPLQLAGEPLESIQNAMPFVKSEAGDALRVKVDETLAEMKKDGTLSSISQKWFKGDITQ